VRARPSSVGWTEEIVVDDPSPQEAVPTARAAALDVLQRRQALRGREVLRLRLRRRLGTG
jgi:hypothetical protein